MPEQAVGIQDASDTRLSRVLGPLDATCIVVGAVIGVGIFFTPSQVAQTAGSSGLAMAAWGFGGLMALAGALTFAELGSMYPRSGAQYEILRDAYGPLPAFLFVFCNATAIQAGAMAIIAWVCSENILRALGGILPEFLNSPRLSTLLIVILIAANARGVRLGAGIQKMTVYARVATLAAITLLAALWGGSGPPAAASSAGATTAAAGTGWVLFAALVPVLFAFGGWQHALWIGGEVRHSERVIPRAIALGMLIVVAVYLLVNWAYFRLLGYERVAASSALAADAVDAVWRRGGGQAIASAVAVSALGVLNAQLLSGPRLIYGMARDGRFFAPFAAVHPRFRTPVAAILLLGAMALALLWIAGLESIERLLGAVVVIDGGFFALTGAALLVLRFKKPQAPRLVRVPGYPLTPVLFVLCEIAVVAVAYSHEEGRKALTIAAAWLAAALACYWIFFRASGPTRGSSA